MHHSSETKMFVLLETEDGRTFPMKINYFGTIWEIKRRINLKKGIPASYQVLIFQGRVLDNNGTVESFSIAYNSVIQLQISNPSQNPDGPSTALLRIEVRLPGSAFPELEDMELSDSVLHLKLRVEEKVGHSPERLGAFWRGRHEMLDAKCLRDYGLKDGSVIYLFYKPLQTQSASTSSDSSKLKIRVLTCCKAWLNVEVNPNDKVQVLRNELEKQQETVKFELPLEYLFIHKVMAMNENESFLGNNVVQDDEIVIFRCPDDISGYSID